MNNLEELKYVQSLMERVQESLKDAPEGTLRCEMAQGKYPQYYLVHKDEREKYPRGRFLRKSEQDLARRIAQKEYDLQMLEALKEKERLLKNIIKGQNAPTLKSIYQNMTEARKRLVVPHILTDDQYVKEWEMNGASAQNPFPVTNSFFTEKGEEVRSKTEKMIADKLYYMGIPYKYEALLRLDKQGVVYPDFTMLNIRTRETIYLEHFGMMDNPEYCKKAIEKIEQYEQNGIYQGEKLLVTFECSSKGINMKQVELLLERHLL